MWKTNVTRRFGTNERIQNSFTLIRDTRTADTGAHFAGWDCSIDATLDRRSVSLMLTPSRIPVTRSVFWPFLLCLSATLPTFAAVTGSALPYDYEQPASLSGRIYDSSNTNRLLFTFRRTATRTNSTVSVVREFRSPDNSLAARETVTYESNRLARFELDEPPNGTRAVATVLLDRKQLVMEYAEGHGKPRRSIETLQEDTLIADMIAPFIQSHWDRLMRGESVRFRFIAVARRETVGFKLVKESESKRAGTSVVRVRMEPTSIFIAAFVDPLHFTIEKEGERRVLDYTGRTTPRVEKDGEWKDVTGLTVFDWK